jgi:hypothetical protein
MDAMGHRHQSHRRRAYGRRQHELRERHFGPLLDGPLDEEDLGPSDAAALESPAESTYGRLRDLLPPSFQHSFRWSEGRG